MKKFLGIVILLLAGNLISSFIITNGEEDSSIKHYAYSISQQYYTVSLEKPSEFSHFEQPENVAIVSYRTNSIKDDTSLKKALIKRWQIKSK